MIFVKKGRLGVEIAIKMENMYNDIEGYLNCTFIFGDEINKTNSLKNAEIYKSKSPFSLMSTFNYTLNDPLIFSKEKKTRFKL